MEDTKVVELSMNCDECEFFATTSFTPSDELAETPSDVLAALQDQVDAHVVASHPAPRGVGEVDGDPVEFPREF